MIDVFDIDGTLADNSHRIHYIAGDKRKNQENWDAFYDPQRVLKDKPIEKAQMFMRKVLALKHEPYFLTGRPEALRLTTLQWLSENFQLNLADDRLLMRTNGNYTPAKDYKREQITALRSQTSMHNSCYMFFDDDTRNFEMYSEFGLYFKAPECFDQISPALAENT